MWRKKKRKERKTSVSLTAHRMKHFGLCSWARSNPSASIQPAADAKAGGKMHTQPAYRLAYYFISHALRASFIDFGGCRLGTGVGWWWALLLLAAQPIEERATRFRLCQSAFRYPPA